MRDRRNSSITANLQSSKQEIDSFAMLHGDIIDVCSLPQVTAAPQKTQNHGEKGIT